MRAGSGGTDLTLRNTGVADVDRNETTAGRLNVLLLLRAMADFGIDLRPTTRREPGIEATATSEPGTPARKPPEGSW